jgi:hypothetical protein
MINRDKSANMFSPNTQTNAREQIRGILSISQEVRNERYLDLLVSVGKSRKRAFEYIKQKIWIRIQG